MVLIGIAELAGVDSAEICLVVRAESREAADFITTRYYTITRSVAIDGHSVLSLWSKLLSCPPTAYPDQRKRPAADIGLRFMGHQRVLGAATIDWTMGCVVLVLHGRISVIWFDPKSEASITVREQLENALG